MTRSTDCGGTATTGQSTAGPPPHRSLIRLTLVTSAGCRFCQQAEGLIDELQSRFPLLVERVELTSPEGTAIARRFRVPFPPVLLLDGVYHGHGRISERKLTRALERRVGGES